MPAARAASEKQNTVLYLMILFVVLFLAAGVLAIVQYMNNEQLVSDALEAEERLG